jgi:ABC-type branched-subunit amino acid transport system substrate-binding protein
VRRLAALVLGSALVTACGTTVPLSDAQSQGRDGGLSPEQPSRVLTPAGDQAARAPSQGGTVPTPRHSDTAPGSVSTEPTGTTAQHTVEGMQLGPGVDANSIRVGFTIQANSAAVSSIASAYNVQLANDRGAYEALVNDANAHGGVGGRKIKPVYFTYDPSAGNAAQIGQAACANLTEDNSVFAAIDTLVGSDTLNSCLQKRGRVMLEYGLFFGSASTWHTYPNEVAADGLPFDVGSRILAEQLSRTGFLSAKTRLGVIVRSSHDMKEAYSRTFVPTLARLGLKVEQSQYVRDPQSESDLSGYTSDISSAVLKFRSSGVDRVVFFDTGSYAALVFSQTAEDQGYRPRYGFTSYNSIVALSGSGSAAPQKQMVGAQGVSWEGMADGLLTTKNRSARRCDAVLKAAGIVGSDAGTEASYQKTCQTFFLFEAAATRAGSSLNRDTFLRAVEALGAGFEASNTWDGRTSFAAGDHSGVSVFRAFGYREACSCFSPTGSAQPVGPS